MGVGIKMTATLNSQNVAANTSSVTVKTIVTWDNGTYNTTGVPDGSMTINGATYIFSGIRYNAGRTSSGSDTIMTKTVTISHNTDGTKAFSYSAVFNSDSSSGTQRASGSMTLPAIARLSDLSIDFAAASLDKSLSIVADRKASAYTHTLTYECGDYQGTICTKSSEVSWNFTPPLDWANVAPNATSVWASFKLETFNGNTSVGSVVKSGYIAIPTSVVPSCSVFVEDLTGNYALLGKYLQSKSKLKITVSAAGTYGSTIKGYTVTADGNTYTTQTVNTDVLQGSGQIPVTVVVTDSRGRTATASQTITVEPYTAPHITMLTVHRCNEDGSENQRGLYCKATFSFAIASLDEHNVHTAQIRFKKSSATAYTVLELETGYAATGESVIFPADDGSTYDVLLYIADRYLTADRSTKLSTGYTLMHWASSGKGIAFGKVSEQDGMEIDMKIDVHGNCITNLATPSDSSDAATKEYVDEKTVNPYPVGSIYMSVASTSPASLFGGTWEQIKDKFLLAAGDTYAAGDTGGEATHKLSIAEMPQHGHPVSMWNANNTNYTARMVKTDGSAWQTASKGSRLNSGSASWQSSSFKTAGGSGEGDFSGSALFVGSGTAHNNMPPYLAVYIWKRTA